MVVKLLLLRKCSIAAIKIVKILLYERLYVDKLLFGYFLPVYRTGACMVDLAFLEPNNYVGA